MKETTVKINKTKSWFFEKINKIDKLLARLIKQKREKNQINKIRNEKGEVTTDNVEIQRIIRDYYELYGNKMYNMEEMDRFLEKFNLSKIAEEGIHPNSFYKATITLTPKPDKDSTKKRKLQANITDEKMQKTSTQF